jgi:phosphopantothenoylcysteine decarboxylase/phosphopantothenate--cysteine ligase
MHPSDEIRASKSNRLYKKKIILGVTGSIAAVETLKISRELIRYGADVIPVMTLSATKFIHPDVLWFATGNRPIVELSGATEHVTYCGKIDNAADLILICPCTSNTISKIAHGIDDNSVTTFATTALGSKIPILIVPAMHLSMYDHKIIQKNVQICKENNIKFIGPIVEKNKIKTPRINTIVDYVIREINYMHLTNKRFLIVGGPTIEAIDDIRYITNQSSGKTCYHLSRNAFLKGLDVEVWYGEGKEKIPEYIKLRRFKSSKNLMQLIEKSNLVRFNVIIMCAAISDYIPVKQKDKIPSGLNKLNIRLNPAPKLISLLRKKSPNAILVGFKVGFEKKKIIENAINLMEKNELNYVICNKITGFSSENNEIWILNKNKEIIYKKAKKEIIMDYIIDLILEKK